MQIGKILRHQLLGYGKFATVAKFLRLQGGPVLAGAPAMLARSELTTHFAAMDELSKSYFSEFFPSTISSSKMSGGKSGKFATVAKMVADFSLSLKW